MYGWNGGVWKEKRRKTKEVTTAEEVVSAKSNTAKSATLLRFQKQEHAEPPVVTLRPPHLFDGKGKHQQNVKIVCGSAKNDRKKMLRSQNSETNQQRKLVTKECRSAKISDNGKLTAVVQPRDELLRARRSDNMGKRKQATSNENRTIKPSAEASILTENSLEHSKSVPIPTANQKTLSQNSKKPVRLPGQATEHTETMYTPARHGLPGHGITASTNCDAPARQGLPGQKIPNTESEAPTKPVPTSNEVSWAMDVPRVRATNIVATGKDKMRMKKQNRVRRNELKQAQTPTAKWTTHRGDMQSVTFDPKPLPAYRGQMCPSNRAKQHPAGELLSKFASTGCPVNTGRNWTKKELQAAVDKGPHTSALHPDAIDQITTEIADKVTSGQARVVLWDDIKDDPPAKLKISPFAMIPHKSRKFRGILDLTFPVTIVDENYIVDSVNAATSKTAPQGAIDQIGQVLPRIIAAIADSKPGENVFMAKFDIKDGFWRLVCEEGEEWNFAYVLPQKDGEPTRLVIPTSLQMGWIESPGFFCAAAETARDVAEEYTETPIGSLPTHKFNKYTTTSDTFASLPPTVTVGRKLKYLLEVYVDDYIALALASSQQELNHLSNAIMHGIHDVFPSDTNDANDPIAEKKLKQHDGEWSIIKELLGWEFDGEQKTMQLNKEKLATLLAELKTLSRSKRPVRYNAFEKTIGKARNAALGIPAGKGMFSSINSVMALKKPLVYIRKNSPLWRSVKYLHAIIKESQREPTHCAELVTGAPHFVGICDAAKEGAGGVILGEQDSCVPTVFRLEWPQEVRDAMLTQQNPTGSLTNSDLEMAGLLLLWLVIEAVCPDLRHKHVAVFSDNTPTVSWVDRLASKQSKTAGGLLRALSFRMRQKRASPLTALHIRGKHNSIADIPSRSFGGTPAWHCRDDKSFLTLFDNKFPLPQQNSWQLFQIAPGVVTRVISILRTTDTAMDAWLRLPNLGKSIGGIGKPMSGLYQWSLTYRQPPPGSKTASERSQVLLATSDRDSAAEDARLQLQTALRLSQPLVRRSPWTRA